MANTKDFYTRIQNKHDTEANWNKATNFTPLTGEIIVYDKDTSNTVPRIKVGDGETKISNLPFITDSFLKITGGNLSGHLYLTGAKENSSTSNTSQIVFGTASNNHVAISSNNNAIVINPTTSTTTNQIVLYLDKASTFPNGISGNASTATALTSSAGSSTQPIYFSGGKPVATTYTLGKSVPSDAKFTDTTYSNFVKSGSGAKAGLVPAPSTTAGTTKYLREDGTWQVPPNTTYSNMTAATASAAGKAGLVPAPAAGKQASFLRGDGTWVVPTNTTYSAGTGISLSGTTFSNSGVRSITTGSTNGTISVNTNGTSANVAVKGLGTAAYTNSTAYATSNHNHGGQNINPSAIELGGTSSSHGGYIDFHYGTDISADDYTVRLIEDAKGQLRIIANIIFEGTQKTKGANANAYHRPAYVVNSAGTAVTNTIQIKYQRKQVL